MSCEIRSLETTRRNYLYDDWEQIVSGVNTARGIPALPDRGDELGRARNRWACLLSQGAFFKRTDQINWRVPPDAEPLSKALLHELMEIGASMDQFLQAVELSLESNALLRDLLGFPACPEEEALLKIQRGARPVFFRLDLCLDRDLRPKLLEVQTVMGGLGITQALRSAYGPHHDLPGTSAPYEEAVLAGLRARGAMNRRSPKARSCIAVLGTRNSSYRHDHLVLARHLSILEMIVAPLMLLEPDMEGRPSLPGGRRPRIIHRLFRSPFLFRTSPNRARLLLESLRDGHVFLVNPWKDVLEDKRILAVIHHPSAQRMLGQRLSTPDLKRLRELVPATWVADRERISELVGRTRSQRNVYLKKGRSFESRQLYDGQQVSLRRWEAACKRAREEGDWVVQEAVRGAPWRFRYLDFTSGRIETMDGYVRLSPFFFRTADGGLKLGDVLITARPERSRIHGASDAVLVVPGP